MAVDWIKMRTDLYRHPKVCVMADCLMDQDGDLAKSVNQSCQCYMAVTRNVTRNAVVGALCSVWGVMRHRGQREGDDLVVHRCHITVIDDIADLPGFGLAMNIVGWAQSDQETLVFPRFFAEMNCEPGGLSNADRQRRYREKKRNARDVTLRVTGDAEKEIEKSKSREENNTPLNPPKGETAESNGDPPKKKRKTKPIVPITFPPELDNAAFKTAWDAWAQHRREIRKPLTPKSIEQQIKQMAAWGSSRAIAAIEFTIGKGWQGLNEPTAAGSGQRQPSLGRSFEDILADAAQEDDHGQG